MSAINCPKCSSQNIYQERDRTFEPDPWILVCHTCGHRIYGEVEIRGLIQEQAPHLVKAFSAHIAARKAEIRENIRPAPSRRPVQQAGSPRRGRVLVHCALCGIGIWRRPYDVKASPNKRFFCSLEHLTDFKRREMEDKKAAQRPSRSPAPGQPNRRPGAGKRKSSSGRRGALMVHCAVCGKGVWRRPWDVKTCKSGLFFCSGEHRLHWLRSGQPLVAREQQQDSSSPPAQLAS